MPTVRDQLFFFIREVATQDQSELILGAWCLAAHDIDRQVSTVARESWSLHISPVSSNEKVWLNDTLFVSLCEFVQRTLLDPSGVYLYVYPPQPVIAPPPARSQKGQGRSLPQRKDKDEDIGPRAKTEDDEEQEQDRRARLRIGALGSAEWISGEPISSIP